MSHSSLRRGAILASALLSSVLVVLPAGAGVSSETADVVGQGSAGPVVAADGATLQRSDTGISVKLAMPTPAPGTYLYPPANAFQPVAPFVGHPEAFSLWVFVFNYPALCSAPCDSNDLGVDKPAMGGAFNGAGHIAGGPHLNFSGRVSKNTAPLAGTPFVSSMLLEPRTAEVHLAVAPHGGLQPHLMPDQITKPVGATMHWWLAIFE
jgi:hypothetical protein